MTNIYEKLRERLDQMSIGYPSSDNGVELRILEQLFSIEDAEVFLAMKDAYQSPSEVAVHLEADPDAIAQQMEIMAKKGIIFRLRKDGETKYRPLPFIIGIIDFQVNKVTDQLLMDVGEYFSKGIRKAGSTKPLPMTRALPVRQRVVAGDRILPHDDAVSIVKSKDRVSLAPCLCRQIAAQKGDTCKHPVETCLQFDSFADYYVENGMARYITKEEAISILERNEERGLVIETTNSKDVELMCSCCSCHCSMLMFLRNTTGAAREVVSNYVCQRDESACVNCGVCVERCPVRACRMVGDKVEFKQENCIGCGLCVSTCKANACALVRKSDEKLYVPPDTIFDAYDKMKN